MTERSEESDQIGAVRRLYEEVWSEGHLALLDDLLADPFEHHGPAVPDGVSDAAGYREFVMTFRTAFPDTRIDIVRTVEEGPTVAVRWLGSGTHDGDLMGIAPTGQRVANPGVSFVGFDAGVIGEIWDMYDTYDLLTQVGVVESMPG